MYREPAGAAYAACGAAAAAAARAWRAAAAGSRPRRRCARPRPRPRRPPTRPPQPRSLRSRRPPLLLATAAANPECGYNEVHKVINCNRVTDRQLRGNIQKK